METTKDFREASTPWQVAQGFVDGDGVGDKPSEGRLAKMARAARKSLFLTQRQLAMALDMTGGAVCWWETGRSKPNGGAKVLLELIAAGDQSVIDHVNDRLRVRMKEEFNRMRADEAANPTAPKKKRKRKKKIKVGGIVETQEIVEVEAEAKDEEVSVPVVAPEVDVEETAAVVEPEGESLLPEIEASPAAEEIFAECAPVDPTNVEGEFVPVQHVSDGE